MNTTYVIVDFQAKNQYTHHAHYVLAFSRFLEERKHKFICILPVNSVLRKVLTPDQALFMLRSPLFGDDIKESPIWYLVSSSLEAIHRLIPLRFQGLRDRYARLVRKFYVARPLHTLKQEAILNPNSKIVVLLPTCDPLGLELVSQLSSVDQIRFVVRMVGGESRGFIRDSRWAKQCSSLQQAMQSRLQICFEVQPYGQFLTTSGIDGSFLAWLPVPPLLTDKDPKTAKENDDFVIGFMGMAKKRKGFDKIPSIIAELKRLNWKVRVLCQETLFPWESFEVEREAILAQRDENTEIQFLPANLAFDKLGDFISNCDYVFLPYDQSYEKNGSAMLYLATDRNVAVACPTHVGFAKEVERFHIGVVYGNLHDLITKLLQGKNNEREQLIGFESYREERCAQILSVLQ